jgi:hypothetical protein
MILEFRMRGQGADHEISIFLADTTQFIQAPEIQKTAVFQLACGKYNHYICAAGQRFPIIWRTRNKV